VSSGLATLQFMKTHERVDGILLNVPDENKPM
jgi:hypothetical protein